MKNWGFLFTAYSLIWIGLLGYLIVQFREQRRLGRDVERLKKMVKGGTAADTG